MKNILFLANIFFIILSMCAMEFTEKLTPSHLCHSLHDLKTTDHTLKILIVVKVKLLPWKHGMITKQFNQK